MTFALTMAALCGLNTACAVIDAQHHSWMIFANTVAAILCFTGAMRAVNR